MKTFSEVARASLAATARGNTRGATARLATVIAVVASLSACGVALVPAAADAFGLHRSAGSFGEPCSGSPCGAGQFDEPSGVAVDSSTSLTDPARGDVFVVDKRDDRVERFNASGSSYLGELPAPPEGFAAPEGIAIDNSGNPLDPSAGDVYVVNSAHDTVDKYKLNDAKDEYEFVFALKERASGTPFSGALDGIAVDADGSLWIYQSSAEIDEFTDAEENQYAGPQTPLQSGYNPKNGSAFAVDTTDDIYVIRGTPYVAKLTPQGESLNAEVGQIASAIAIDPRNNDLYEDNEGSIGVYRTPEREGVEVARFGEGALPASELEEGNGLALNSSSGEPNSGRVYASDPSADLVQMFAEYVLPDTTTGEATGLASAEGQATLSGIVNPDGVEVTECKFEYGTEPPYDAQSVPCETAPGAGNAPVPVSATIHGLTPGATYRFRLVAGNAEGSHPGEDEPFIAYARPKIDSEFAEEVTTESAKLAAAIDPGGSATTYRFEFGPSTAYGSSLPLAGATTNAALTDVPVSVPLHKLQPGSEYHYRVVAVNALGKPADGEDHTFTTRPASPPAVLPDGRAWELVSPPNKHGAAIEVMAREGPPIEASENGDALAYAASASTESTPEGNPAKIYTTALATRGGDGWSSRDITPPHRQASGNEAGRTSEYVFFSSDLSLGAVFQIGANPTPLAPTPAEAVPTEQTVYVRNNLTARYEALVTVGNVPAGTKFGVQRGPELLGASPDLEHVVLSSTVPLTAAPIVASTDLYEWTGGQLRLVSALPDGAPASAPTLGRSDSDVQRAVSDDGERVIWAASNELFVREHATQEQSALANGEECTEPAKACTVLLAPGATYQTASSTGSLVFFTDEQPLTGDSTAQPGAPDLYAYDVNDRKLTDLTVDDNAGESAAVQGAVLGASEDGSRVYFVASGVLAGKNEQGQAPVAGGLNVYLVETKDSGEVWERPRFIAALSAEDGPDWEPELGSHTSRVSPNGNFLAFMSDASLTGYDNIDVRSGQPDEEVYLYDAGSERLACASCNPSNERPEGFLDPGQEEALVDRTDVWQGRWLAANIPGWTLYDLGTAYYQSRYLSNSGRLFFNSDEALVPQDVDGTEDVYEYEPPGVGSCSSADATYSPRSGGCVALISSGRSGEESAFLDASESGGDVFFVTAAKLVSQDYDTDLDVYDAHECTSAVPCPPAAVVQPPACTTEASCKAAPSPQPSVYGAPSSATFSGPGNLAPAPPATVEPKPSVRTKPAKLTGKLKTCRARQRGKRARKRCEARARKSQVTHRSEARTGRAVQRAATNGKGRS
jgi:hypothetical protein